MKTYIPAALASAALIFLGACSGNDKGAENNKEELPVVKVQKVYSSEVAQTSTYTATVEPNLVNNISSSMPLRIKSIYVDEGMRVSKGQRLVVLDDVNCESYRLQVDNAKAALHNVQLNYNRALELYKIGGGTKQNVDQMEAQLVNARTALASAERQLRNARENTVLVSPISGVVTARNYDPGDMTSTLPILTIGQVQPVKVVVNVSESELANVRKGMSALVTFDTYGDREFTGTVSLISPTVDVQSKTFGVEITLQNPKGEILPGMFARVTLNFGSQRHVVVPDRAVVKQPGSGNNYVYVYRSGEVSFRKVELGRRIDQSYEIVSGIEDGDDVVVSGQSKLANGMKVKVSDK